MGDIAQLQVGDSVILLDHFPTITVAGVVGDVRPHLDQRDERHLYYFVCQSIDDSQLVESALTCPPPPDASSAPSTLLKTKKQPRHDNVSLQSPEGYRYVFNGWYDAPSLLKCDAPQGAQSPEQVTQLEAGCRLAATNADPCELQYLGMSMRPWFWAPFTALGYLSKPSAVAYSVYLCHRCLAPYFDLLSFVDHMELCDCRSPPGVCVYDDAAQSVRAWLIDGSDSIAYGRHLALLTRCFVESKLLHNDADKYYFAVVTVTRSAAVRLMGGVLDAAQREELEHLDDCEKRWAGNVVVGFFCICKQRPNHALSCIVTLPCFLRCGVGTFMINLAYYISHLRRKFCGGAMCCGALGSGIDRPFSASGEQLIERVWRDQLLPVLCNVGESDTLTTLEALRKMCGEQTHLLLTPEDFQGFLLSQQAFFYAPSEHGGDVVGRLLFDRRTIRPDDQRRLSWDSTITIPMLAFVPSTCAASITLAVRRDVKQRSDECSDAALRTFVEKFFHSNSDS